ncbi:MAG: glucose-1-phosphate thymidylyltransferase RfbA [Spirochaetes bacterium]|nr:glucose-1-phosphate thymidylyltransferase RfbA [Spirochaetota bacterium]
MKGIILAGGSGTRLYPITRAVSKQLVPVYDKPMIYYPLSVLMLAGIREVLVISTPEDTDRFRTLLGDGGDLGMRLSYAVQPKPEGLAQAFHIGASFVGSDPVALVLGDNIFYGQGFSEILERAVERVEKRGEAVIFGYVVNNPEAYGVATLGPDGRVVGIEEKPANPKSHHAVVGLYFYPPEVIPTAAGLKPSARGELEITDLNNLFIAKGRLAMEPLGRGFAWLDTGTHESLLEAGQFVEVIEKRQGLKIACIEEIAWRKGWIDDASLRRVAEPMKKNQYGQYLLRLLEQGKGA